MKDSKQIYADAYRAYQDRITRIRLFVVLSLLNIRSANSEFSSFDKLQFQLKVLKTSIAEVALEYKASGESDEEEV